MSVHLTGLFFSVFFFRYFVRLMALYIDLYVLEQCRFLMEVEQIL